MPGLLVPKSTNINLPWKNGLGVTDEVFIQPAGASRDAFDLRVSSAPIAGSDKFSGYPGVDRWITVIEGGWPDTGFWGSTTHGCRHSSPTGLIPP